MDGSEPPLPSLPPRFAAWFAARGWAPRVHQLAMVDAARRGEHALLIAPTGGGKTLAGFLPSLIELAERPRPTGLPKGVHTLYISPLKALAVDIARNLDAPVSEMRLPITVESRTGDTNTAKKGAPARQRAGHPPDHARAAGVVLRVGGCARILQGSALRDPGRNPRAARLQARRPAEPRPRPAAELRSEPAPRGPERDGGRARAAA